MAKTSKETSDREKACRFLITAFFQNSPGVSEKLLARLQPFLQEGDPVPDVVGTSIALARGLENSIRQVVRSDGALFTANAALDAARQSRIDRAADLSRRIIGLRSACKALFIDLPVQQLGFDQRTAQDPVPLLIQADRVAEHLREGTATEANTLFEGDDFNPKKYADEVEQRAGQLRQALDQVAETRRLAEKVMLDKRTTTEEYDELFLHSARTFESYCRLVGFKELADRVRPSETRRGRTEVPPGEVAEEETQSPADSEPVASGEGNGSGEIAGSPQPESSESTMIGA